MTRLGDALWRGVCWSVVVFTAVAWLFLWSAEFRPAGNVWDERGPSRGTPEFLVARHGCWTHAAPEGAIAHHVVFTRGTDGPRLGGERMTRQALEQVFYGVDHGLIVHGFCR